MTEIVLLGIHTNMMVMHIRLVKHPSLMMQGENVRGGGTRQTVHGGRHLVTTSPPHSRTDSDQHPPYTQGKGGILSAPN